MLTTNETHWTKLCRILSCVWTEGEVFFLENVVHLCQHVVAVIIFDVYSICSAWLSFKKNPKYELNSLRKNDFCHALFGHNLCVCTESAMGHHINYQ